MLYVYGGSKAEAGRIWYGNPEEGKCISAEEEANAPAWSPEAAG